jgi:hypothetical protein
MNSRLFIENSERKIARTLAEGDIQRSIFRNPPTASTDLP